MVSVYQCCLLRFCDDVMSLWLLYEFVASLVSVIPAVCIGLLSVCDLMYHLGASVI